MSTRAMTLTLCRVLLVVCVSLLVTMTPVSSRPVSQKRGHYFVFWKITTQEILPKLDHLAHKTRKLIQQYFEHDLVNLTNGSEHSMEAASALYDRLNLTKFPSDRVLERENKSQFIFIKGLLKENYRLCDAYTKILLQERRFRCNNITDDLSRCHLCKETKALQRGLREVTEALRGQLVDFFLARRLSTASPSKRERKIKAYLNKKRQTDKNNMATSTASDKTDDVSCYTGSDMDSGMNANQSVGYRRRNRASVGLLYAVYIHIKDTQGTLKYGVNLLQPQERTEK